MNRLIAELLLSASALFAVQRQAHMQCIGGTNPGFFIMQVRLPVNPENATTTTREMRLLCDQLLPNITTEQDTSWVAHLGDLTHTQLADNGDPQALQKYQWVAILALQAYANPALAADVVRAARIIVDGQGQHTTSSISC